MKKKLLALMITVLMTVLLAGCGNDIIVDVVTNEDIDMTVQDTAKDTVKDTAKDTEATLEEKIAVAETNPAGLKTIPIADVKVGVLYIGSAEDVSGYTYAHELGIQGMVSNLGMSDDQVVRKEMIDDGDNEAVKKALA